MSERKSCALSCADCGAKRCNDPGAARPDFCTGTHLPEGELREALACYDEGDNRRIMEAAARTEFEGYCKLTRVEEVMDFARRMGYQKLGIATCLGLLKESRALARILRANGFEVCSIACKAGEVPKTDMGIGADCAAVGVNICNPILQAKHLNHLETELNIVVGLCVGHDSLFYRYSAAPATTLVAKDRVTGHNPAVVLNCLDTYYSRLIPQAETK